MARYTLYRDDNDYPLHADSLEEMRKLRSEGNHMYMSHYYGTVAYDAKEDKYVDIYKN